MKVLFPVALTSTLLISACASSPLHTVDTQSPVASPPLSSVHNYRCESGETIAVTYPSTDSATLDYKGRKYNMQIAISGSGARYVDGKLEWWTKGSGPKSEGTLFRHVTDGTTGASIELCSES